LGRAGWGKGPLKRDLSAKKTCFAKKPSREKTNYPVRRDVSFSTRGAVNPADFVVTFLQPRRKAGILFV